jgi:hypothetical protein
MSSRSQVSRTDEVLIRSFQAGDEAAFRSLNEQWIKQYFRVEAKDEAMFADPQKTILKRGGQILFAVAGARVWDAAHFCPWMMANLRWPRWLSRQDTKGRGSGAGCYAR